MTATEPPLLAVTRAESIAALSPCAKSRRGVAAYMFRGRDDAPTILGEGYNGPAVGSCDGSEACRRDCAKRCVHAESRAIRAALSRAPFTTFWLVHVKLDGDGRLVAGGGPSCWQCSKEIVEVGNVTGIWLYEKCRAEAPHPCSLYPRWSYYTAEEFHRETLEACGIGGPR